MGQIRPTWGELSRFGNFLAKQVNSISQCFPATIYSYQLSSWTILTITVFSGLVVLAQLAELSLLIPEVRSSNPVIEKYILNICLLSTVHLSDENKGKRGREWPVFLKKQSLFSSLHLFLSSPVRVFQSCARSAANSGRRARMLLRIGKVPIICPLSS